MKNVISHSGKLEYHLCALCGIKTYDWEKHILTKKHKSLCNKSHFDSIIINSRFGCKFTPLLQFIPKVKWKKGNWKVVE